MDMVQIFGDYLHLLGIAILLMKILLTKNCTGISGKTQLLHALVFTTRYLDAFHAYVSLYDTFFKIVFTGLTYCTVVSIFLLFRGTYDSKRDGFRIELLILPSAVLALFLNYRFETFQVLRTFSAYLEAVAIVPQVYLVSKSKQIESIVVSYVACLGLYEGCYVMRWLYEYSKPEHLVHIDVACGIVQLIFYADFFARNLPILKVKGDGSPRVSLAADKRVGRTTNAAAAAAAVGGLKDEEGKDDGDSVLVVVKGDAGVSATEKVTLLASATTAGKEPGTSN